MNLALPLIVFNDTIEPDVFQDKAFDKTMQGPIKVRPGKFTKWDKIDIKGPMTINDLVAKVESELKMSVSIVSYGSKSLYTSFLPDSKKRAGKKID